MNKEQQELFDLIYQNYWNFYPEVEKEFEYEGSNIEVRRMTQQEFIDQIKTDDEFAKQWGLTIEVRELSHKERCDLFGHNDSLDRDYSYSKWLDDNGYPKRAISLTYNNKTIESYE